MIAFSSAVTKLDIYRACAEPGILRASELDSVVYSPPAAGPISESYNHLLDWAAGKDDLEALVLVHQDAEVVSPDLCQKVRAALEDPDVGVIGCAGAIGVRSIAWWEGSVTLSSFANRYWEHGGGDLPGLSWDWDDAPPYARIGEVDTLDGFVLVLSPWVVRNLRFDEALTPFHGYDLDFCLQARTAGRKIVTADFRAIHHRPLEMVPDVEEWVDAHVRVAEKWTGRMPGIGTGAGTWKQRARRAEAEADAARTMAYSRQLECLARTRYLERVLAETTHSLSWRIAAPLRRLAAAMGRWRT